METATALLGGLLMVAGPTDTLAPFGWQARPIVIFAQEGSPDLAMQLDAFGQNAAGLAERRNVVVVDTNAASQLRDRFEPDGFTVVLVGLDGGEKARTNRVTEGDAFDRRIDAMPMRRRESGSAQ
jgi:hypothetical protein